MRKGTTHSEATRLKMRLAKLGKPGNRLGYRLTEDQKKHLSLVMTGKKHCLKTRKKIRITAKEMAKSKAWRKKVSEGTKRAYQRPEVNENRRLAMINQGHGNFWKGHVTYKANGYKMLYKPNHQNATKQGYIMEHRFVMSEHIGRPLTKDEVVHHIDHDITNNDISNLQLFESKSAHRKHHANH